MIAVPPDLLSWADLLSKFGQFLFGLCTLVLAIWAATAKRKDFFRSELSKKQLEEMGKIRVDLQSLFFDLYYISITAQTMKVMEWNIYHLKKNDPESWEQVQRYKRTSLVLFYKLSSANYYLLPGWLDRKEIGIFVENMKPFAPFTILSTSSRSDKERESYVNSILKIKNHFDAALRAHA